MRRPGHVSWIHGVGVALSAVALVIGGFPSPAIGFPIAIGILIALEIPHPPRPATLDGLRSAYGSILEGGFRRGLFIKEMFAVAVTYSAVLSLMEEQTAAVISNVLLGAALTISSIGSELEAVSIRRLLRQGAAEEAAGEQEA